MSKKVLLGIGIGVIILGGCSFINTSGEKQTPQPITKEKQLPHIQEERDTHEQKSRGKKEHNEENENDNFDDKKSSTEGEQVSGKEGIKGSLNERTAKNQGGHGFSVEEEQISEGGERECLQEYETLLKVNSFDFSPCTKATIREGTFSEKPTQNQEQKNSMVIIFDASGSMGTVVLQGKTRMDIAQQAIYRFLESLEENSDMLLSMVVYGHKGGNTETDKSFSCSSIEKVVPLAPINREGIKNYIASLSPTGWTPIAASLEMAEEILTSSKANGTKKYILLVSDGKETCEGSPIEKVRTIKKKNPQIIINVIGFHVIGEEQEQLELIAEAGDGEFYGVETLQDFEQALEKNKQMLQKTDFTLKRTAEQIYDISFLTNTYFQCLSALRRESIVMMIDIHNQEIISRSCQEKSEKWYIRRYQKIENHIEENYENGKKVFSEHASSLFKDDLK
jgi:Mg-chelatase subunit ChlD